MSENMPLEVIHNREQNRFEIHLDGEIAELEYVLQNGGKVYAFTHTGVPEAFEGRGVGSALVKYALDEVRAEGAKMAPLCPFVAAYVKRHKEYEDLRAW